MMKRTTHLKNTIKRLNIKMKSFCANDVDSWEEIDNDSSCEDKVNNFMFMAIDYFENEYIGIDLNDEEAMLDMEGELIKYWHTQTKEEETKTIVDAVWK